MPGVALSSLRVSSDLDVSGYVRGAAQKVAADQQMIAADKARNASLAQADAALAKIPSGVASVSKALLDGYGAGAQFEAIVRRIGSAADRGLNLDRVNLLLDAAYRKFGLTADAASLAEKSFVSIAPAVDALNQKYAAFDATAARLQQTVSRSLQGNLSDQLSANFGVGTGAPKSAQDSADVFLANSGGVAQYVKAQQDADKAQAKTAASAAALREQINPLEAEVVALGKQMAVYSQMLKNGDISATEFEQAQAIAAKRLSDVDLSMRQAATGGRVLSGELGNLGYQLNDVITGLALGQPVFMIAAQQGGQIYQIFSHSKAGIADFATTIGSSLLALVTPGRVAFAAIAAGTGLATAALFTYEGKIQEVQRQLTGIGRASGASATAIDAIGQTNSSPTGLSTNEARNLAAALAATGKVGVDSIGPIVALGHDFAKTYGVDAKEATDILAKAFADPAKGADDLNQRLGFLDANTKILIESLVTQGNRTEAVRILTDKIRESIASAADITSFWARAWTVTGNSMSDFFDRVGRGADRVFNGGSGLDEKISNLTIKLLELQRAQLEASRSPALSFLGGFDASETTQQIAALGAQIDALRLKKAALDKTPTSDTRDKQRGLEIDAIARAILPTIDATRKLDDETKALNEAVSNPALGKYVSIVGGDLVLAAGRAQAAFEAMRGADPIKNQIADTDAQIKALDQRSIAARSQFARDAETRRQSLDPNAGDAAERLTKQNQAALLAAGGQTALDNVERQRIATLGGMASISEVVKSKQLELDNVNRDGVVISLAQQKALRDLAREQALGITAMKQQADTTRIQAETLGMSVGAAAEYTAVQTRLAQALRDKQVLTTTDIAQIKAQAAALGQVTQAAALATANDNIRFGARTALLSPDDVQIAQQLKGIYPDVATALNSVQAAGMQTNQALSGLSSTVSGPLVTGFADIADGTKSVGQGATDMKNLVIRALEEMLIKIAIVTPALRALQLAANSLGLLGGGAGASVAGGATSTGAAGVGSLGGLYANGQAFGGNVIPFRSGGAFTNGIFSSPTLFKFARGGAMNLGVMGEAGDEAVMPLRRGADGKLGVAASGGGQGGGVVVNVYNAPAGSNPQTNTSQNKDGSTNIDIIFKNAVSGVVADDAQNNGPMSKALMARAQGFGGR